MGGSGGGSAISAWGKQWEPRTDQKSPPAPPPRAPFWTSGIQNFEDVCLDNEAVVDLIRLVTLALLPSRIQESEKPQKYF